MRNSLILERPRRHQGGHTLLELTIVVTILSVLMTLVARAQRPFSEMVMELQDRAVSSSELHMAVDYIARDCGAALEVKRLSKTSFLIQREEARLRRLGLASDGEDPGLKYSYRDGQLLREDKVQGGSFVVATGLTGFEVSRMRSGRLRIKIQDGIEPEQHEITLVWSKREKEDDDD